MGKWENFSDKVDNFLEYFAREKLNTSNNWYEAAAAFVPSTSNGIECCNRLIKDDEVFREQWPIGQFLNKSLDIVKHWSEDRNPDNINCKRFHLQPNLGTKEWKAAYSWLKVSFN